jgi:hypothetical protein
VLGGGDEHVDAGLVQKPIEVIDIEWDRFAQLRFCYCHLNSP